MPTPKDYRIAPGMDRCDSCFSRRDDGLGCTKHDMGAEDGYQPNRLCNDYAPRSGGQRYQQETPEPKPGGEEPEKNAPAERQFSQTIAGVEIMRVGTWNGTKFKRKDLEAMVDAFAVAGFSPPVKVGHVKSEDAPAWGWVERLRVDGDTLVADFRDVPDELVELIREKRYDAVSAEVWWDLKVDAVKLPIVLKAVALLGAHPPAVAGLKPVSASLTADFSARGSDFLAQTPEQSEEPGMTKPANAPAGDRQPEADDAATRLAELQASNDKLQRELDDAKKLAQAGGDVALRLQRLEEDNQRLTKLAADTSELRRQERIDTLAKMVKVPALRGHFAALADLATREVAPKAVEFAKDGEAKIATDPIEVLKDLADRINQRVDVLFTEEVKGSDMSLDRQREELTGEVRDPGMALMNMADELQRRDKISFDEAKERVFANPANKALVAAYNRAGR